MRKGLLTSFLFFLILSVSAQNYPFEEESAKSFFSLNYPYSTVENEEIALDSSFVYKNLTIVNFSSPRGFVMLRSAGFDQEVMGYSFNNQFSFDADTTGVLEDFADAIAGSPELIGYDADRPIPRLKTGRIAVEPMVQTAWNQGWPYNFYCPHDEDENRNAIVGCVAVAVGQIIRYYDKWNNFEIQYSYEHEKYGNLSCFAGSYNWAAMENKCYGINHEVARLLYHSGVLVNMGYGTGSSGASSSNAASLFNRIYAGGFLDGTPYSGSDDFYNSISQYKPIYATYTGHAFVCDGFDGNSYYHFNLGWGGSANGFYPLTDVLGKELTSAIFDTSPVDSLKPPKRFSKNVISDSQIEISWYGPDGDRDGLTGYSIYLDDVLFDETTDTTYLHSSLPGSHYLRVTANYSAGESRWIGPGSYFSHGNSITIPDLKLKVAMNTSAGIPASLRNTHDPTEGELLDIKSLSVTNLDDLTGIGHCKNLRYLTLFSSGSSSELDLTEIQECTEMINLKISNYMLVNPEAIGALTKLQDLKLLGNSQGDMTFLAPLSSLLNLQIDNNPLDNVGFLNDLDKLTKIVLTGCGIESFDLLENTFGLQYLDISNNQVTDISWLSGNRTLYYLNAGQNQISGEVSLEGILELRDLILPENQIESLKLIDAPFLISIDISDNQIRSIKEILEDNGDMTELNASNNLIDSLPLVTNKLADLNLGGNLIYDLVPIDEYGSMTILDLQDNRITDLSPLMYRSYASKLERLNLRNNPISKESFVVYKPQISAAAGATYLPSRYYAGSPCYLLPTADSVITSQTISLSWEGDYDNEGYTYDVYLAKDEGDYTELASGISEKVYETDLSGSGNYKWYVVAGLEEDTLRSGYSTFKVFSGFTLPFFEDFEIYTPNEKLCNQSPYWRVYDEGSGQASDAYVQSLRAYEGNNSIKIGGATDLLFPVTEYLTGYLETSFMMMIDRDRQATIRTMLNDGTSIDFFFYKAGVCEVYQGATRHTFFNFDLRTWMKMEIISDESHGLEWRLDNQEILSLDEPQPINSIRFCTIDGPGYYESAPTVLYLDNFAIDEGMLLAAPLISLANEFQAKIYTSEGDIIIEDASSRIKQIDIYNFKGQLINRNIYPDFYGEPCRIQGPVGESGVIIVIYDEKGRRHSRAILK